MRKGRGLDAPFPYEPCVGMMSRVDMTTYLHRLGSRAPFQTTWTHKASISGGLLRELGSSWDMTDMASFDFFPLLSNRGNVDTLRKFYLLLPRSLPLFSFPLWGCSSALDFGLILWWLFRPVILFFSRLLVWGASGQHQSYQKSHVTLRNLSLRPSSLVCTWMICKL